MNPSQSQSTAPERDPHPSDQAEVTADGALIVAGKKITQPVMTDAGLIVPPGAPSLTPTSGHDRL